MKLSTKLLTASAMAAVTLGAASAASAAVTIIADFHKNTSTANNFDYVVTGPDSAHIFTTSTATATTPGGAKVKFSFDNDPALPDFTDLVSTFNFDATVTNTPAFAGSGTVTQNGINGTFSFVYGGPSQSLDGFNLVKDVTTLFSGTFSNAWIQGQGGVGGIDVTIANNGSATFSSSIYDLSKFVPHTDEYTLSLGTASLTSVDPSTGCDKLGHNCSHVGTTGLKAFRSFATGDFQAAAVPEPATWGLMLVGFGGMGAMLRNRRRMAAVAA